MEKLRNWYTMHIRPVLPCLRIHKRGMMYITLVLALVLLAMDVSQMVWQVSRHLEREAAGGEAHLICRNITEEQVETLRRTRKNFAKYRDGAFEILSVTPLERSYDTVYDAEIRLVLRPKEFYKGDLIVGLSSFLQNYSHFLLSAPGAEITVTPLYYAEAEYRFSTFVYHVLELLSLRSGEDMVMTVLETEVPYLVKPFLGLDPDRVSEATVHFAHSLAGILAGGLMAVAFAVWLETEHMQYDFAVFTVFGADTKRLTVFLLYKLLTLSLCIQIPCAALTMILGLCLYGTAVFSVSPGIFLFSMAVILGMVPLVVRLQIRIRGQKPVIAGLSAEDNTGWLVSPGHSLRIWHPQRFALSCVRLNLLRYGKFFAFFLTAALVFTGMLCLTVRLSLLPAGQPQFTAEFLAGMEYAVYEEKFVPAVQEKGVLPLGQIRTDGTASGIRLQTENGEISDFEIAAIGETLYVLYPEARQIVGRGEAFIVTSAALTEGDTLELLRPQKRIGALPADLPQKQRQAAIQTAAAYDSYFCTVGGVQEGDETIVYLPWTLYSTLAGERTGNMLSCHIRLPDSCIWTGAETYKSTMYTDTFLLRCMDTLPAEMPYAGDYMDVLLSENAVALCCSRETLAALGYTVGDRIELSDTGHLRLTEERDAGWYRLTDLLKHKQFRYTGYPIAAVFLTDTDGVEIRTGPVLYEKLTGISMCYSTADLTLPAEADMTRAETDSLWTALRQTAGTFYEVCIRNHDTAARREWYQAMHRPLETWVIRCCAVGCMGVILWEMLALFDSRRRREYSILRALGGDTRQIRRLRWGCMAAAIGISGLFCTLAAVLL